MSRLCKGVVASALWMPILFVGTALTIGNAAALPSLPVVVIEADLHGLPISERKALAKIIHAARRMDALYIRQVYPKSLELIAQRRILDTPVARAELDALAVFKGPWLPDGKPYIEGVPTTRPIGDYYPPDATKNELEGWLTRMSAAQRSRALDAFTVIRRSASRGLEIVPYSGHYGGELRAAARDLAVAAQLTHEPSLERFLSARARALLDDDYYKSDLAFVALQGPIDVVVGPYETDDDEWFGAKTTYEGAIGIVDSAATRQFAALTSRLQELEDSLPLEAPLRGEKLRGGAPILIADSLYQGGDFAAGGAHIAYNLPNDLRVQHAVGARTVVYRNVLRARYDVAFRPISQAMLPPAESAGLTFEDFLSEFVFVRAFDTLGPHTLTGTTRAIADALQENASVAGQIRSMLLSVWGHHYLLQHGYQEKGGTHAVYAAFLVRALSQVRDGVHSEQARGYAYVLNRLLEGGGVRLGENGVFLIDEAQAHVAIEKAAREFVSLMASGDTAGISAQLTRYAIERPEVQASLQRVAAPSALQRPLFRTADELDPPH